MKTILTLACVFAALQITALAEVTAEITGVHLCCKGCVNGIEKAVGEVSGAKVAVDQGEGKVTLTADDAATAQKAADALVAAGYFGECKDGHVKLKNATGAKGQKVQSLKVEGVHLCCGKCVKAVDEVVKAVPGAKDHNATKGAKSFDVNGDFSDKEFFAALQKQGLAGKIAK
jgi:copper chaperone CopZ